MARARADTIEGATRGAWAVSSCASVRLESRAVHDGDGADYNGDDAVGRSVEGPESREGTGLAQARVLWTGAKEQHGEGDHAERIQEADGSGGGAGTCESVERGPAGEDGRTAARADDCGDHSEGGRPCGVGAGGVQRSGGVART